MVGRYAAVVERQFDVVIEERRALVGSGDAAGVSLLDRLWRQHLARCADLRDGAHLARLGGRDPLSLYTTAATESFARFNQEYEAAGAGERGEAVLAPATTWTYLVNDDPFRHTMGSLLTGPGGPTVAIYAAALLAPLFLTWGVVERWWGGKKKREPPDEDSR
jgi:preprotein translocase subunit SecA